MPSEITNSALEALPAFVGVVDMAGVLIWVNDTWRTFADLYASGEPLRSAPFQVLLVRDVAAGPPAEEAAVVSEGLRAVLAGTREAFTLDYPARDLADVRWFRLTARALPHGAVVQQVEITDLIYAPAPSVEPLHDPLTGLPGHLLLHDRFVQALLNSSRSAGRVAVLELDLDGFAPLVARLGRPAGDDLLVQVARRLRPLLRAGDTAARAGGDEFMILLLNVRFPEEALAVAERIARAFDTPFEIAGTPVTLRLSIGIASEWSHLHTEVELREAAALALRQAKREGRAVVLFEGNADP